MIPFMDSTEKLNEADRCLDSQLWHACAGGMVQMPPVNSKVFYFAQGHAEHASEKVDFRNCPRFPPHVLCKVASVRFMADPDTDEVFAKISLIPVPGSDHEYEDDGIIENETHGKPASFAKTLTQSDANNGGGFSVPRYCAETIFPRLDYKAEPPVQTILVKDVNGVTWKFRHIYRGTPRRHLLTTGWSTFVNHKKLVAGDSIVFLRAINGDLCVGIRRAKRGIGGLENSLEWNPAGLNNVMPYGGFSAFLKEEENRRMKNGNGVCLNSVGNTTGKGKLRAESVIEAATLAANGQPFEVTYYPRASTPEFCVKASLVKAAMYIHWCSGMRFKMAFETEDSSRISWFMGTIFSVQVADPIRWPDSPWRLLQVTWDEPNLLQNVKCVNPWLVELVSNMPTIHLSSFSQPRKKPRLSKHPDFPLEGQLPLPSFSGNLLGSSSPFGNTPAGIQGARHARYGLSLSDFHFNKVPCSLFRAGFPLPEHLPNNRKPVGNEDISCSLTMGNSTQTSKNFDERKAPRFILFGQPILTEEEILQSLSGDTGSAVVTGYCSSGGNLDKMATVFDCEETDQLNFDTGHCKVFLDSDDLGRTLDISLLGSYDELYERLAGMFGLGKSGILNNVLYRDANGVIKRAGEETFREFATIVKRLMIITDSGSDNLGTKEK